MIYGAINGEGKLVDTSNLSSKQIVLAKKIVKVISKSSTALKDYEKNRNYYIVLDLYVDNVYRTYLSAMLFLGKTFPEIAEKSGYSVETINDFSRLFFDLERYAIPALRKKRLIMDMKNSKDIFWPRFGKILDMAHTLGQDFIDYLGGVDNSKPDQGMQRLAIKMVKVSMFEYFENHILNDSVPADLNATSKMFDLVKKAAELENELDRKGSNPIVDLKYSRNRAEDTAELDIIIGDIVTAQKDEEK